MVDSLKSSKTSRAVTYARVGFCEAFEDTEVERGYSGRSDFLLVIVEPQIVGAIGAQVVLLSVQVGVPTHFINYNN